MRTNSFAADVIGKAVQWRRNVGTNVGDSSSYGVSDGSSSSSTGQQSTHGSNSGTNRSTSESQGRSWGASEVVDYAVQPAQFTALRKGGPQNAGKVDGVIFQGGRMWSTTRSTWMPLEFQQG